MPTVRATPVRHLFLRNHFGSSVPVPRHNIFTSDCQGVEGVAGNGRVLSVTEVDVEEMVLWYQNWSGSRSKLSPIGESWKKDALEQLNTIDEEAREEGIEPPPAKARDFAREFIEEFANFDLPLSTVFADEDRGVSIQMEKAGFFFLLTCFENRTGIYNVAHQAYSFSGSFREILHGVRSESELMQALRCWIGPLTNHAERAD